MHATSSTPTAARTLPDALTLGPVHLVVTGLDRSVAWYTTALGLRVVEQGLHAAALGDGVTTVLVLHEDPTARAPRRESGLYHVALLYPSRQELARAALRLAAAGVGIQGASDHGTHEALYLADPDGNGLELAADRPREVWPTPEEEFGGGGPRPLDIPSLLGTVQGRTPPAHVGHGLRVGHVHLHVGSVADGLAFYRDVLGLEVWGMLPSAAFVSAGGYHHHLAFNVWRGEGAGPQPPHTVGLHHWTIQVPEAGDVDAVRARMVAAGVPVTDGPAGFTVRDPWDIPLHVTVAGEVA